jgi:dTDP-L-rhamnose 4-epimerase
VKSILVTGGAGFVGSHIVDALIARGHRVRVLDALVPQVHGSNAAELKYLPESAEFIRGDVTDIEAWRAALQDVDVVYHEAAEVGVGQSMYEIVRYMHANTLGTAILLELLASGEYEIEKLIVASSMSIYGEGAYRCSNCGPVFPELRTEKQLRNRQWEMFCPNCRQEVTAEPTAEDKPLYPTSIYAISKRDQEEMCLTVGRAYGIPTVALRYFNIYGPRQAVSNPYTGVAAIFSSRLLNQQSPLIFEDGLQSRDFVHVSDIVQANLLALESEAANYEALNIGTGRPLSVLDVANALIAEMQLEINPQIVGKFREGDIRHCYSDISKAQRILGYAPQVRFEDGVTDLVAWVKTQESEDLVNQAVQELEQRGLTK